MRISAVHSVAFSPCGGTLKALRAVVSGTPIPAREHDLTRPAERPGQLTFGPEDLVYLAFPVYGGRLPSVSAKVFEVLKANRTPAVLIAVYGNREYEGAFLDLQKLALGKGFKPVAAVAAIAEHSIAPEVAAHRPDPADVRALSDFGRKIFDRVSAQTDLESFTFEAPGFIPDRPPSGGNALSPTTNTELCTDCGQCVTACPVGAVSEDPAHTSSEACIGCMACVKICPVEARELLNPRVSEIKDWLKSNASERKEIQTFF